MEKNKFSNFRITVFLGFLPLDFFLHYPFTYSFSLYFLHWKIHKFYPKNKSRLKWSAQTIKMKVIYTYSLFSSWLAFLYKYFVFILKFVQLISLFFYFLHTVCLCQWSWIMHFPDGRSFWRKYCGGRPGQQTLPALSYAAPLGIN